MISDIIPLYVNIGTDGESHAFPISRQDALKLKMHLKNVLVGEQTDRLFLTNMPLYAKLSPSQNGLWNDNDFYFEIYPSSPLPSARNTIRLSLLALNTKWIFDYNMERVLWMHDKLSEKLDNPNYVYSPE